MNDRVWTSSEVSATAPGSTGARRSRVSASCRGNTAPRYHPIRCPHSSPAPFAGGSTRVGEAGRHRTYCAGAGRHYLIGRYYDPATGQFLSVDPLVDETGQAYAYTGGDPVNGADPTGTAKCGGWLSFLPCGTITDIQNGVSAGAAGNWLFHLQVFWRHRNGFVTGGCCDHLYSGCRRGFWSRSHSKWSPEHRTRHCG